MSQIKNLRRANNHCFDATLSILWQTRDCVYLDSVSMAQLNRDAIQSLFDLNQLSSVLTIGTAISHQYEDGELIQKRNSDRILTLKRSSISSIDQQNSLVKPGRYYPKSFFELDGTPLPDGDAFGYVIEVNADTLVVDFNHPLAGKDIELRLQFDAIYTSPCENHSSTRDVKSRLLQGGVGMQEPLSNRETNFWGDDAFTRNDEKDDAEFFAEPSFKPFWDRIPLGVISNLYNQLIPQQAHILDLMAGVHSPLQECTLKPARLVCAGLNFVELEHNPMCDERQVLNVNTIIALPYRTHEFDIVLIHAAIEYVTQPEKVMDEIQRILKPGGRLIISFSHCYVEDKAIQVWKKAYPFERFGIILTYLRAHGLFEHIQSFSFRGLSDPQQEVSNNSLKVYEPLGVISADSIRKTV